MVPARVVSVACVLAAFALVDGRQTFGVSYKALGPGKQKWPEEQEVDVFNYTCPAGVCAMDYFWAGGKWDGYYGSRMRYYVDGETAPSVSFPFDLAHGSNMVDDDAPWSAGHHFGKTGQPSGIFNVHVVPFTKSVRVTVELTKGGSTFWLNLRGRTNSSVKIGGERLPPEARLRTFETTAPLVQPGHVVSLMNVSAAKDGAVYLSTLSVSGYSTPTFLEGCFRAHDPGATTTLGLTDSSSVRFLVSSGTEDYFLGTYYFNRGKYTNAVAGLTNMWEKNSDEAQFGFDDDGDNDESQSLVLGNLTNRTFSAYRIHDADPFWFEDGLVLSWRNWDPPGCDMSIPVRGSSNLSVSALVLAYEW